MTEEKTLEEVLLNLLKQGFQITFGSHDPYPFRFNDADAMVVITFKKNDYKIRRIIPADRLVDGLMFCVKEFNQTLAATIKKEIETDD